MSCSMKGIRRHWPHSFSLSVGLLLSTMAVAGCGEKAAPPETGSKKAAVQERREQQLGDQRQRELERQKKLEDMAMPQELPREWFWDGDGVYDLTAEWLLSTSRLRLTLKPSPKRGAKRQKRGEELSLTIGFYQSEYPRGPYEYVGRVLGSSLALPQAVALDDVRYRHYKALVFDENGSAIHATTPVQPVIEERRSAPAPKPQAERTPTTKPASGDAETPAAEAPVEPEAPTKKPVVAVAVLQNGVPGDKFERGYLGRGLTDVIRQFCAETADIETPDPGYMDFVIERHSRGRRGCLTPTTLANVGQTLQAEKVVTGTFEISEKEIKIEFSFVNVATGAILRGQPVTAANDASDEMGEALGAELAQGLGIQLDDAAKAKFSLMWKKLNERRRHIDKALVMSEAENPSEAIAAFESVKPSEVRDGQVLMTLGEFYAQSGNALQGARLMALASHVPDWTPSRSYVDLLGRTVRAARDVKTSLDILADVRGGSPQEVWDEAMKLLEQSLASRVISHSWKGPKKKWPVVGPVWQATASGILVNPHLGDGSLVVFESADPEAVRMLLDPTKAATGRGRVQSAFVNAELYTTSVYDLNTGALRWKKAELMSGVAVPAIADGTLFGMGPTGPVAVSLAEGKVLWEDTSRRVDLPATLFATTVDYGRPWWLTFEFRRVENHLVVWHPQQNALYAYDVKTGEAREPSYHNDTWGLAGQFFLERPDGLHFLRRGSAALEKLTDQLLENPATLTTKLRMLPDPGAVVYGDTLFDLTRRVSPSDTSRFDIFVVGSDVKKGEFKWVYPLLSERMPLVADG
ncbi:MAG TPA: PQQ-binding-like beta-propeller repeat protein, partial [Planctomycetota bacterium]|nr:PQQ-binding-like beta-propeller repeat protein [Planctomycetota bacterium]